MNPEVRWEPVHQFVGRLLAGRCTTIVAGTAAWEALDDKDPQKVVALLAAASRWCLETELDQIDQQRRANKEAALDISEARDWAAVAQEINARDAFYRSHPYLRRKSA